LGVILGQTVLILFGINQSVFSLLFLGFLIFLLFFQNLHCFMFHFHQHPFWFPLCFEKKAKQQIVAFVDLLSPFLVR